MKKIFLGSAVILFMSGCNLENELDIEEGTETLSWFKPSMENSWRIQENGVLNNKNSDIQIIDLFKYNQSDIYDLKQRGSKVICSFSAGEFNSKINLDANKFPAIAVGNIKSDNISWIDINDPIVKEIMLSRIDYAKSSSCDGVRIKNADLYNDINTGFNISIMNQISFNLALIEKAHKIGLSIGFNNVNEQIENLKNSADFLTSEECHINDICNKYETFTKLQKPVYNIEYNEIYSTSNEELNKLCLTSKAFDVQTVVTSVDLNGSYKYICE